MSHNKCPARQVFEPDFGLNEAGAMELWQQLQAFLEQLFSNKARFCFIFDQTERYINVIRAEVEREGNKLNGYEVFFFLQFIRLCRATKACRTVFTIRAEYLYESFDFLESIASTPSKSGGIVSYFLCPGINSMSAPDGARDIRESFRKIPVAGGLFPKFERVIGLDNRSYSNTFLAQLVGFMIEHFYSDDPNVRLLLTQERNRSLALRYYFDHLLNDYRRLARSHDAMDLFKSVLFTIAIENRVTGKSVTGTRLAALVHMPEDYATGVATFLKATGVLLEEPQGSDVSYRLAHDLISDYVIENDQFAVDPVLKEEIRGLCENRAEEDALRRVEPYANLILDWKSRVNTPLVAIWVFLIYGLIGFKIDLCGWIHPWFSAYIPQTQECTVVSRYYIGIFFMHAVWLTFIYHIHRDYLRYTLHSGWLLALSEAAPVGGAILAILVSFSPALLLLPVVFGGICMAFALLLGAMYGSFIGRAATENTTWGALTLINMLVTSLLTGVAWLVLWDDVKARDLWDHIEQTISAAGLPHVLTKQNIAVIVLYALNIVLIYFWIHIRRTQQSRISFAARLALYDRTRLEEK